MQRQDRWMEPQTYQVEGNEWIFQRFYDFLPDGLIRFNIVTLQRKADFKAIRRQQHPVASTNKQRT